MFRLSLVTRINPTSRFSGCLRRPIIQGTSTNGQPNTSSSKYYHVLRQTNKSTIATISDIFNPKFVVNSAFFVNGQTRFMQTSTEETYQDQNVDVRDMSRQVQRKIQELENKFARFEQKCQQYEKVYEGEFVKILDLFTSTVQELEKFNHLTDEIKVVLSSLSAILLRCCGKLMIDTPEKARELLAGNLWQFIGEKRIPIDTSHYNSLLRILNENHTDYDPQKILDEMSQKNLNPDRVTYQRLIHQYCQTGDVNGATKLLAKMKELDMELTETIFASFIIGYGKQDEPPSVKEMFDLMRSNGVEPDSKSYTAAIMTLADLLKKDPSRSEELKTIYDLLEQEDIQLNPKDLIDVFEKLIPLRQDEVVASILKQLYNVPIRIVSARNRLTDVLLKLNAHEEASKLFWTHQPGTKALNSSSVGTYYIKLLCSNKNVPADFVLAECMRLKTSGYNSKAFYHLYYGAALEGRMDLMKSSLEKISQEEPITCKFIWPLIAQSPDEASLVEVLKNYLKPSMNTDELLETFSNWVWPKFSENTKRLFELNKEQLHYDNNLLMASFLTYSVQESKVTESIEFLNNAPDELISGSDGVDSQDDNLSVDNNSGRPDRRGSSFGHLLLQIAEHTKDPTLVTKAFNLCRLPGRPVTMRTCYPLVKVHLMKGETDQALETFYKLADEYRMTPCSRELLTHCLNAKDQDSLKKVMDTLSKVHGDSNSLLDLAFSCLVTGKIKQAQKIFASPDFKVNPQRIYRMCQLLSRENDLAALENFVHLSRDIYDVDQEYLYQILIDAYERTSNPKRALDLWNKMQEEEFQPSKRCLLLIADVLERSNIEVPFQKPLLIKS